MIKINMLIILFIILSFSCLSQSIIKNVFLLSGTNLITNDEVQRDGIVVITLETNENTTICNFNFDERSAGVVCRTLGFPAEGLSIVDNRVTYSGPVLLANVQCVGTEAHLSSCVSSGRSEQTGICASHTTDVHVYCVQQKVPPIIVPNAVVTTCNKLNTNFILTNKGNQINSGLLQASLGGTFYYVCNDDYSFQVEYARMICNLLCNQSTVSNILMPYFNESLNNINILTSVRLSCNSQTCSASGPIECFKKSFLVGLQCGEELQVIEKSPNVTCTTKNMTVSWNAGFLPPINSGLISFDADPGCTSTTTDSTGALNLIIVFDKCRATINGDPNNIYFSYKLTRKYAPNGLVTYPDKSLTVNCSFPKPDQNTDSFLINSVTNSPINSSVTLERRMEFYRDISYSNQINPPGMIDSDKKLFVKVYVVNPTKNISLALSECWATTSSNSTSFNRTNSVSLIGSSCPKQEYDVLITPFSRTEVRFSFTPFKITSSATQPIYVACITSICYLTRDGYCPYCGNRKKRSTDMKELDEYHVQAAVYVRIPNKIQLGDV